ncbi:MAG: nucleotidyltransferase family protein [Bacteroidales bacterium]|jgi:D-glycero-alpha-D-manno-heptose 1-phosphate guanylyltransferase|nr:nucleotidyltransferase family protein [Bacteroidales bacterium]
MKIEQAIILSGGKGTRLKDVVSNVPKPMAEINNIPFLTYLIRYLKQKGIKSITLSTGYLSEKIIDYYKDSFEGVNLNYAIEKYPLGTGGAICFALEKTTDEDVLVLNGDSFIEFSLDNFYKFHKENNSTLSFLLKEMENFSRYGRVEIKNNRIVEFKEKTFCQKGLINTGVYLLKRTIFNSMEKEIENFSFEKDYIEPNIKNEDFFGYITNGYFIDIGLPEDYKKAQKEFLDIWKQKYQEHK